jgi:hypothetical protein
MADLSPLRIGVTGSRRYGSPAVIRSALLAAHDRARPHAGHVLVHGQCDPYHPDTGRAVPWFTAKALSFEAQGRLLGGDWLSEWVALDMAHRDGITWRIERHPADWRPAGKFDRAAGFKRNAGMVQSGPFDEWEAFVLPCTDPRCRRRPVEPHDSHGASHCAERAADAGIPVRRFTAGNPA